MNEHIQFDEDFDLYALGAFDPEEKLAFESHLQGCEICTGKLAAAQVRMALVSLSVPQIEPPARIKQRLIARIQDALPEAKPAVENKPENTSRLTSLWQQSKVALTFAAIATAVCLIFAFYNYRLQQRILAYHAAMQTQQAAVARAH